MPKRLANGLTLLSAVVCVGSAMLVGRSFFWADSLWIVGHVQIGITTIDGLGFVSARGRPAHKGTWLFRFDKKDSGMLRPEVDRVWLRMQGVRWLRLGFDAPSHEILLPLWPLPLLTAIPPVRWWRARWREGGRGFAVAA